MIRVFIGLALGFKPSPFSMPMPCTMMASEETHLLLCLLKNGPHHSQYQKDLPRYKCTLFHITYLYIGKYTLNGKIICQRKQIQQTE